MPILPPEFERICELMPISSPPRADQCAAGVTLIDRRIGLQEIFEAAVAEPGGAALGADDPRGDGLADAQRIADGQGDVANPDTVGIPKAQSRQIEGIDF